MADLSGRHALVTGAGTGVGAAIAFALAEAGAMVKIAGRRPEPLDEAASAHARIAPVVADVTDAGQLQSAIDEAAQRDGAFSVVVANAGAAMSAPFLKTSPDDVRAMLDVNLVGVFNTFRSTLAGMKQLREGRLISIASTAGIKGYPYVTAYCAAKHGVVGLTRALASELAPTGITVNAVCPGFANTPMLERTIENIMSKTGRSRDEAERELKAVNPQNRFIQPEEVAAAVLWLCSDAAASVTGQAISVSGGET